MNRTAPSHQGGGEDVLMCLDFLNKPLVESIFPDESHSRNEVSVWIIIPVAHVFTRSKSIFP